MLNIACSTGLGLLFALSDHAKKQNIKHHLPAKRKKHSKCCQIFRSKEGNLISITQINTITTKHGYTNIIFKKNTLKD